MRTLLSAQMLTTRTWCKCSQGQHGHCVGVVKNMKMGCYVKLKIRVCVVADYTEMRISNFANKYLTKSKTVAKPFLPVHTGLRRSQKSRDTVPLRN